MGNAGLGIAAAARGIPHVAQGLCEKARTRFGIVLLQLVCMILIICMI
jgi:hypothetical protein